MSGIYGICGTKHINSINRISKWNRAYGNDKTVFHEYDNVHMGVFFESLSKYSTSYSDAGKYVIDAVIYNRDELVKKYSFDSNITDDRMTYEIFIADGAKGLSAINGDFAGVIYDSEKKHIHVFRDHMGIRPLYYYMSEDSFIFSSDIRGILAIPELNIEVSDEWLYKQIMGWLDLSIDKTEYENVFAVHPGSVMTISLEDAITIVDTVNYWSPAQSKIRLANEEEYIKWLHDLIFDSVRRRADVIEGRIGAELSGGLDSSVIDVILHRLGRESIYVSWSEDPKNLDYLEKDERLIIKEICDREGIECHYLGNNFDIYDDTDIVERYKELGFVDESAGDERIDLAFPAFSNTHSLSGVSYNVRKLGSKVVFTGHGGDEGVSHRCNDYELFHFHEYLQHLKLIYDKTKGKKLRLLRTLKRTYGNIVVEGRKFKEPFISGFSCPELVNKDLAKKFSDLHAEALTFAYDPIKYVKSGGSRNRLDNIAFQGAYMGVRYMIPYLDYRVIDYALSIPRHMFSKGMFNRYIFREAFKEYIPHSLYILRDKCDYSRSVQVEDKKKTEAKKKLEDSQQEKLSFVDYKKKIIETFDKEYVEKMFDSDKLSKWINMEESEEVLDNFSDEAFALSSLIAAQETLKLAVKYTDEN